MKKSILEILTAYNDFVSGQQISAELGISRAAVWKSIQKLREQGCTIEAISNKGYKLIDCPDGLALSLVSTPNTLIGKKIYYYPAIASTNNAAKAEAVKGAAEGSVFIAGQQTEGKGRMGRVWTSSEQSLCLSILLRPSLAPAEITAITLAAGLAVAKAIRGVTGLPALIKWPNDIVMNGKKVCGILTEMAAEAERIAFAVVGMGINVNDREFPAELADKATSLYMESGREFSRSELLEQVLIEFEKVYLLFLEKGIQPILTEYSSLCATLGKEITASGKNAPIQGRAKAVNADGSLTVETVEGDIILNSGEVSVRGLLGYI